LPYRERQSFLLRSKCFRWFSLLVLLGVVGVFCWGGEKDRLFKQARKAEKAGKHLEAYLLYSQARALEPTRERYILAAEAVRERAAKELSAAGLTQAASGLGISTGLAVSPGPGASTGLPVAGGLPAAGGPVASGGLGASTGLADSAMLGAMAGAGATGALEISAGLAEAGLAAGLAQAGEGAQAAARAEVLKPIGQAELQEVRRLRPPVELTPDLKLSSFRLKGSIQETYEKVAREYGLDVLFDSDYQGSQQTRFELSGCDFQEAILALNDVADSFIVPISPKLFLVAADNAEKRTELEPVIAVLQPIPDTMTPEEVTELSQAVQQSLEMKRLQIDTTRRQVFMRDTVTRVRLAQAMLAHLSKPRAEVVLDVELYAVSESDRLRLGLGLPSAFPIENLSTLWNNQPSVAEGITHLLGIGGGKTVFGLAIGSSSLVANRLTTESRLVSRFRVRASSGMAASLHIGEKYPIINARFSPILDESGQAPGAVEPFPSFTFEDLGLVLDMVPVVHSAREVSLQFEVQFRLLTGSTANDIPIISNREFKAYARIVEGEMAVISGIGVSETFRVRTGVVGLSEIPWLGNLFKRHTRERLTRDLLVLMQPHVVRLPPAEIAPTLTLRYGPEQRPLSGI
jgi:hypothetical protein